VGGHELALGSARSKSYDPVRARISDVLVCFLEIAPDQDHLFLFAHCNPFLHPKGNKMSRIGESAADRILRHLRDRDRLLKEAPGSKSLRVYRTAVGEIADTIRKAREPGAPSALSKAIRENQDRITADLSQKRVVGTLGAPIVSSPSIVPSPEATSALLYAPLPGAPARAFASDAPRSHEIASAAELGRLVREARKAIKLSQGEFAAYAGVGRRFLSEPESGKPSLEFNKVVACAKAAGIDLFAQPRHG